jgi:hypothetical protein
VIRSFVIVLLICVACNHRPVSPRPPEVMDTENCSAACDNLKRLRCEEGNSIPTGLDCVSDAECGRGEDCFERKCVAPCDTFCRETQNWGVWLQPRCVSMISSCTQLETCN